MKPFFVIFIIMTQPLFAQEIQLYSTKPKGSEHWNWEEKVNHRNSANVMTVYNVSQPTLTVFMPDPAKAIGTSIIVCPGGGFHFLAIDHEGTNVAKELVRKGITVFVLKYRLIHIQGDSR
jgi:hypothetical protein